MSRDERVDQKPKIFAREAAQVVAARNKSRTDDRPLQSRPKSGMQTMVERLQSTPTRPKSRAELLATAEIIIPPKPQLEKAKWTSTYAELNKEEVTKSTNQFRSTEQIEEKQVSTGVGRIYSRNEQRPKPAPRAIEKLDPRNASRNPSAKKDVLSTFRYENASKSSPSRSYDRVKPWEEDMEYDGKSAFIGTTGNTSYVNLPSNYDAKASYSRISTPKPNYYIKPLAVSGPSALPIQPPLPPQSYMRSPSPFSKSSVSQSELGFLASSAASVKSDDDDNQSDVHRIEDQQMMDHNHHHTRQQEQFQLSYSINQNFRPPSSQKSTTLGFSGYNRAYYSHLGKSMPNVNQISAMEPIPIYPYHVLVTTNFRLPKDVDRCGLEKHLSKEEFSAIFNMTRADFYRMAEWRRNQLKKRFRLF